MLTPLLEASALNELSTHWANTMIAVGWKGLLILGLAFAATFVLRRRAAAARHLIWNLGVVGLLALPLAAAVVPALSVQGLPDLALELPAEPVEEVAEENVFFPAQQVFPVQFASQEAQTTPTYLVTRQPKSFAYTTLPDGKVHQVEPTHPRWTTAGRGYAFVMPQDSAELATETLSFGEMDFTRAALYQTLIDEAQRWSLTTWSMLAWELGALLVIVYLAMGWIRAHRLRRECAAVGDAEWHLLAREVATTCGLKKVPRLYWTDVARTPLTFGVLRPSVLLPLEARSWTIDQRHDVLLHEFAHVQRRDILTQILAQVACAMFWFHPLPWIAASRMRLERERACDDRVLMAGSRASTYASHLLEMARSLRLEPSLATATVAMARRSQLGERMESLLDHRQRGRAVGRFARATCVVLAAALVLPLAAMRPAPAAPESPIAPEAPAPAAPEAEPSAVPRVDAPTAPVRVVREGLILAERSEQREVQRQKLHEMQSLLRLGVGTNGHGHQDLGDHTFEWDSSNWLWSEDRRQVSIEADGRIKVRQDETDIEWMDEGAYLEVEDRNRDEDYRRRLVLDGLGDEGIERRYTVDGREHEWDADAEEWWANVLGYFLDTSMVLADSRVKAWVDEGGIDRALDEIGDIDSDWAVGAYFGALLPLAETSAEQRRILEKTYDGVDSDHFRAEMLAQMDEDFFEDEESLRLWISLVDDLDSDYLKGQSLALITNLENLEGTSLALALDTDIDSDHQKSMLLHRVAEREDLDRDEVVATLEAADELDSDHAKGQVLMAMVPHVVDDEELLDLFYEVADEMDSDHQYGVVVRHLRARLGDTD